MDSHDAAAGKKQPRVQARVEAAALDGVAERLAAQFPELSAEQIADAIRGHYDGFDASPIRDFVPVLVERASRAEFTERHASATPKHRA